MSSTIENKVSIPGSKRFPLTGARISGFVDNEKVIEVIVLVRPSTDSKVFDIAKENANLPPSKRKYLTREEFANIHDLTKEDFDKVKKFAIENGLHVVEESSARHMIKLSGTVGSFSKAFNVKLDRYDHSNGSYRGREGEIYIPKELLGIVITGPGLDNRTQLHPHFQILDKEHMFSNQNTNHIEPRFQDQTLANAYNFPSDVDRSY